MDELAKGALDKFSEFLYAIAPGFVLLFSLMLVDPDGARLGVKDIFSTEPTWKFVGIGIILGIISYAFHVSLLEDVFFYNITKPLTYGMFFKEKSDRLTIFELTRKRWERSASNEWIHAAQSGLDETYLWQFFLYCSGYLMIAGGIFVYYKMGWRLSLAFFGAAVIFLLLGLASDIKTTRHEIKLADNMSQ